MLRANAAKLSAYETQRSFPSRFCSQTSIARANACALPYLFRTLDLDIFRSCACPISLLLLRSTLARSDSGSLSRALALSFALALTSPCASAAPSPLSLSCIKMASLFSSTGKWMANTIVNQMQDPLATESRNSETRIILEIYECSLS